MCHTHRLPCIVTHGLPCVTHMARHVSPHGSPCVTTWLAMCHHMVLHVSYTWLAMCRPTRVSSKYVKFRLSRNSTKFDWVANFHETIPRMQSVLSSKIYKNPNFSPDYFGKLPFCPIFSENLKFKIFTGFTIHVNRYFKILSHKPTNGCNQP